MKFDQYQKITNRAIPPHTNNKDEILHWCIGLSEECGEVMSVIKHHYYGGEEFNREDLIKEIGDVLWYLTALCRTCNISLDYAAAINAAKLMHRYPDSEFDTGRSAKRHDLEKKFSETELYKELLNEALNYTEGKSYDSDICGL